MFHVTNPAEKALTTLRPEYITMRQQLHGLKNSYNRPFGYPGGLVPNFKMIRQSGRLDVSYKNLVGEQHVTWYIHQLSYYRGPDRMNRFLELFSHDEGAQRLIMHWHLFFSLPDQQKLLLDRLIGSKTALADVVNSYNDVAPELQNTYLVFLLKNTDQQTKEKLINSIPRILGEQMASVVKTLRQDESLKDVLDLILDKFLLPELVITDTDVEDLGEMIASKFAVLLDDPDTEALALQKYRSYTTQKLDLPSIKICIEDPGNYPEFRLVTIPNDTHKTLRDTIMKRVGELWEGTTTDEDMGEGQQ